ncbi:excinuclease ABC subunit UvrA [Rhodoferax sp. TBRC 17660]|uniref:UvrABC system protein A n=1 Tax=Rhodoferax potami TaxID=3068338 RepID=A0ABU3KKQ1_9BURK|nr:excinuclease ABC subunit UvrA [Rhodoferax sp. TBRC 17660]MDT7518326.1 excinuclease ABC subunit UvrA [Rhodoferax sp. TBRC 17660]
MTQGTIRIRGARQHNLKNLDLDIRTGELTVVTGPSGSGKSSLVFDTLYAEGQRRYVETFSAYARQFLDRMDKPAVDKVEGVPPAIAIDQTNPVRSSRSTVGTMTELNDHLKLLFSRAGSLFDKDTALPVQHDTPETIYTTLLQRAAAEGNPRLVLTFPVELPGNATPDEVTQWLSASGFTRVQAEREVSTVNGVRKVLDVVADRFRIDGVEKARVLEAIETSLKRGSGRLNAYVLKEAVAQADIAQAAPETIANAAPEIWRFSTGLHCPQSDIRYTDPIASMFSFNSAVGACDACRGFGRVVGVDYGLVIPNDKLTLRAGAVKPMQTPAWQECQDDLMRHAEASGIPRDTPWYKLTQEQKNWVLKGSPNWNGKWNQHWFGVDRFFEYLETKAYKMHIRVLLSKYRSYTTCPTCNGSRLKTESLLWRIGTKEQADMALDPAKRFMPKGVKWSREQLEALPGLSLHDFMLMPLDRLKRFFDALQSDLGIFGGIVPTRQDEGREVPGDDLAVAQQMHEEPGASLPAALPEKTVPTASEAEHKTLKLLFEEVGTRLKYLCDVGIGYLTLDRQSRTLSGGEVQRINLTTALGTSLVNTLFVLDEPSIGLHPRDMNRIIVAMQRLRDAGNTLVVVEHDPAVMLAADRMIDMGPGPGERGGQIVFDGTTEALKGADTMTGAYLGGRKQVGMGFKRMVAPNHPRLILEGVTEHNLKNVSVEIPLQRLVCVTGVSGSGKSTLIQDVLAPALLRHFGKATETPGAHTSLLGAEQLSDMVFVDQSPIGKTARSNPVSYVGAWDAIRELFAGAALSKERSYTAAKFSFNSGDGRCPTCGGSGFEHVEMQFLSDVYLRCPDCDGKRYRPEILEVTIERKGRNVNVADVLGLTVSEAADLFSADREVIRVLQPIVDVGLEYVKLGQPVPTLSGGEAQRLKLAGFLAEAAKSASSSRQFLARKGSLFMLDEPTTGLHFEDIAKLMRALRKLLDAGHSLVVIEHNLDVIRASDWLIDLGPEGGDAGGQVVAYGTPEDLLLHATSHTGKALREYAAAMGVIHEVAESSATFTSVASVDGLAPKASSTRFAISKSAPGASPSTSEALLADTSNSIRIVNAKEHNLKSLSVDIPRGKFSVVTGVSGSGKSTLAFDILFNEGQRRYLESLNAYARSIVQPAGRPEVDAVYGIPPTVAIEQRLSRGGRKSTVGTTTEVWHFLRLLYVKLGTQHCFKDGAAVEPQSADSIAAQLLKNYRGQHIGLLAPLVQGRKGVYTELADWARPKGFTHLRVDGNFLPTSGFPRIDRFKEHNIELPVASLDVTPANESALRTALADALTHGKGLVYVLSDIGSLREVMAAGESAAGVGKVQVFSTKRACPVCATSYAELDPRLFSYNSKHGWCPDCVGTGVALTKEQRKVFDDSVKDDDNKGREQTFAEADIEDLHDKACSTCNGTRLNATARNVKFAGVGITDIARLSVTDVRAWVQTLQVAGGMTTREGDIARDLVPEIRSRLEFLEEVGLGYLTLDRGAPTLSGGEAQRIRLAAQLGSNLQGVCYVLDEPTIGLHARDNKILLGALQSLSDKGNTLVVVEHDEDTIRHADHIIDIGPSAGKRGGRLVAQGSIADVQNAPESQTGRYLLHAMKHPLALRRGMVSHAETLVLDAAEALTPGASYARAASSKSASGASVSAAGKPAKKLSAKAQKAAVEAARILDSAAANTELAERTKVAAEYAALADRRTAKMSVAAAGSPAAGDDLAVAQQMHEEPVAGLPVASSADTPAYKPKIDWLTVTNATMHNLQSVTAHVPLKRLVAITGVSGSGKSTLARDVLLANVQTAVQKRSTKAGRDALEAGEKIDWLGCEGVTGYESIDRVLEVDQTPIGKTPRSCPATYIGFWDTIRKLFADTLEAKARGYASNRFSFNTGEGRCPSCEGQGMRTIGMSFLPNVKVVCETCKGARFNPETLAVTWRGKNIGDVLQMEVDEAVDFFAAMPVIAHPLQLLKDVGLGYLTLGQPSPTLSGGEAQRIKLVTELAKVRDDVGKRGNKVPHTLYVLDEPTVGLHMADVEKLIHVLHRLVNGGHSVVVIEHDLDVIAEADWVLDLGPEGGNGGGRVVAATTPEDVVKLGTHTGKALEAVLAR